MEINQINALIDLMEERSLVSLEIVDGEKKVSLQRHLPQSIATSQLVGTNPTPSAVATTPRGAVENSPMVGVFYAPPPPMTHPLSKSGNRFRQATH